MLVISVRVAFPILQWKLLLVTKTCPLFPFLLNGNCLNLTFHREIKMRYCIFAKPVNPNVLWAYFSVSCIHFAVCIFNYKMSLLLDLQVQLYSLVFKAVGLSASFMDLFLTAFCSGLSKRTTTEGLRDAFAKFGEVLHGMFRFQFF